VDDAAVIRALFSAFGRRDLPAALAVIAPDVEFWPTGTQKRIARTAPYVGHEGIREYFGDVEAAWEDLEIEAQDLRAVAGGVAAFGVARGTPVGGESMEAPVFWVFRLRDGQVVHGRAVATAAEAVAARA
jgi:ketosteroid isomerase-like protein